MKRRSFLAQSAFATAALTCGPSLFAQSPISADARPVATEPKRRPPLAGEMVREFVGAGHNNQPRVDEMLAAQPMLINATWDWGAGDWETALGGASHVGNTPLALHLLERGARIDAFCAAMLGEMEVTKALLRFNPGVANARGPHGYTLLYHVAYAGNVVAAEMIAPHIDAAKRSQHFNQALHSAVGRGHLDFTAWLLEHGVDDPNTKDFAQRTPLAMASAKGFDAVARLLRDHGAT